MSVCKREGVYVNCKGIYEHTLQLSSILKLCLHPVSVQPVYLPLSCLYTCPCPAYIPAPALGVYLP